MTAIGVHPLDSTLGGVRRRTGWPWLATTMIFLAFLVAEHDPLASQKWQKTAKGDVTTLVTAEANGQLSRQLGFLFLGAIGVALLVRKSNQPFQPNVMILFPFCMVLLWAMMSIAWSADAAITFKRQIVLICMLLAVLGLVRQYDIKTLAEITFVSTLAVVLIGIVAEALFAPRDNGGEEYRFAGTLHPNHAALNASFLLLSSLYLARRRTDRRFLIVAVLALLVVIMCKSRTALAGAIVGAAAFALAVRPIRQKLALITAAALVVAVAVFLVSTDSLPHLEETLLLNRANSDPTTLTGRTVIWQFVWERLSVDGGRILAGFGYGGFWNEDTAKALSETAHFKLAEAHNDYLDLTVQLGVVGLFVYMWGLLAVLFKSISRVRRLGSLDAAFAVGLIAFVLVHSIAESAMTQPAFTTLVLWSVMGSVALTWVDEGKMGGAV